MAKIVYYIQMYEEAYYLLNKELKYEQGKERAG